MSDPYVPPPYFTPQEVEAFIGTARFRELFDDDNDGFADTPIFNTLGATACADVDAALGTVYPGPFPITQTPLPWQIKRAAMMYLRAEGIERRPVFAKQDGGKAREKADAYVQRLTEAREWLLSLVASPQPANVGGIITDSGPRTIIDSDDGTYNGGDF